MTTGIAIVEGVCSPLEDAVLPLTDPAVLSGWSVFETLVVAGDSLPPSWAMHMDRLHTSCVRACLQPPDVHLLGPPLTLPKRAIPLVASLTREPTTAAWQL